MDLDEFNSIYFNPLPDKISKESKSMSISAKISAYNVDLLKYGHHAPNNEFLDSLSSHMFSPHMQPTRVTSSFKTLI